MVSKVGQGSEFWFVLPMPFDLQSHATPLQALSQLHLLVADDSASVRDALALCADCLHWTAETVESAGFERGMPTDAVDPVWYIKAGRLDMNALLRAFQKFYRRHSEAWLGKYDFREVGRQLLLMAFLQRILNGDGRIEREMAVGNGRCDLWIEFGGEQFVLELKLNRDEWSEEDGLEQIARYLSRLGLEHGYLMLFELDSEKPWEKRLRWEERECAGKRVTLVGM